MVRKIGFWSALGAAVIFLGLQNLHDDSKLPIAVSDEVDLISNAPRQSDHSSPLLRPIELAGLNTRSREATVADVFSASNFETLQPGDALTLRLFDDAILDLKIRTSTRPDGLPANSWSVVADVVDNRFGRVIISKFDGVIHAAALSPNHGEFEIHSIANGLIRVTEIDPTSQLGCEISANSKASDGLTDTPGFREILPRIPRLEPRSTDSGIVQDVLFVYNDEARISLGGAPGSPTDDSGIRAKMQSAIAAANLAYQDSNIPLTLRFAGVQAVNYPYPKTESLSRVLTELASSSDGHIDEIHAERTRVGADIVSMWIDTDASGGLAYVLTPATASAKRAFNVVRTLNTVSTFVHEVGHNQGNRHLPSNYSTTPSSWFPDSFAHLFSVGTSNYVTIMASTSDASANNATRLLQFSAPEIAYLGAATGITNLANAARTLRSNAAQIASFFSTPSISSRLKVRVRGKSVIRTKKRRVVIRGNVVGGNGNIQIRYRAPGVKGVKRAKVKKEKWTIRLRLKKRKTRVRLFAEDSNGAKTKMSRVTVIRR